MARPPWTPEAHARHDIRIGVTGVTCSEKIAEFNAADDASVKKAIGAWLKAYNVELHLHGFAAAVRLRGQVAKLMPLESRFRFFSS